MVNFEDYLEYSPNGDLIWKFNPTRPKRVGTVADRPAGRGYKRVGVLGNRYRSHGIVWYLHHGVYPDYKIDQVIDHIDGNPSNNKIENLRLVTTKENQQNTKVREDNTSSVKGVHFCIRFNKWTARIAAGGKRVFLGYFSTFEEAKKARFTAEAKLWTCAKIH